MVKRGSNTKYLLKQVGRLNYCSRMSTWPGNSKTLVKDLDPTTYFEQFTVSQKLLPLPADSWPLSHQGSPCVSLWSVKKWVTGLICKQMKMSSFWTHVDPGHQAVGLTWRGPQSSPGVSPGQRTFWQRRRLHQPCVYGWQFTWFSVVFYLLS